MNLKILPRLEVRERRSWLSPSSLLWWLNIGAHSLLVSSAFLDCVKSNESFADSRLRVSLPIY